MNKSKENISAFTKTYSSLSNVIITPVKVSKNNINETENALDVKAIWDTGATDCAISRQIAENLGLIPIQKTIVCTANGEALQNVYAINLALPNNVLLSNVVVTEVPSIGSADMLIGMSVITKGDFSISNYNNETVMSFRIPSLTKTDYVELLKRQVIVKSNKIGRNADCPCGSGKKYKNCCGR